MLLVIAPTRPPNTIRTLPTAGGANVPALNDLLVPFGAAYEAGALDADVHIEGIQQQFRMASGVTLKALPAGAWVHHAQEKKRNAGAEAVGLRRCWVGFRVRAELPLHTAVPGAEHAGAWSPTATRRVCSRLALTCHLHNRACPSADQPEKKGPPVLGLFQHGSGRVGLYGDSNCLDSSHSRSKCFKLLTSLLAWAAGEVRRGGAAPAVLCCAVRMLCGCHAAGVDTVEGRRQPHPQPAAHQAGKPFRQAAMGILCRLRKVLCRLPTSAHICPCCRMSPHSRRQKLSCLRHTAILPTCRPAAPTSTLQRWAPATAAAGMQCCTTLRGET